MVRIISANIGWVMMKMAVIAITAIDLPSVRYHHFNDHRMRNDFIREGRLDALNIIHNAVIIYN